MQSYAQDGKKKNIACEYKYTLMDWDMWKTY